MQFIALNIRNSDCNANNPDRDENPVRISTTRWTRVPVGTITHLHDLSRVGWKNQPCKGSLSYRKEYGQLHYYKPCQWLLKLNLTNIYIFIDINKLNGRGIGFVDMHLLALNSIRSSKIVDCWQKTSNYCRQSWLNYQKEK